MINAIIEGRDVAIDGRFMEWRQQTPPLLALTEESGEYTIQVLPGAPDWGAPEGGFTVWCTDNVVAEWAEYYSDLGTAIARVAVLARAYDVDGTFKDGPIGFVRWAENLFNQTIALQPKIPTGE